LCPPSPERTGPRSTTIRFLPLPRSSANTSGRGGSDGMGRSCLVSTSRTLRRPSGTATGGGGRQWRRRDCHQEKGRGARGRHGALQPHDVDGSRLHRLAHRPARMQDLMHSNVERNFGTSLSSGTRSSHATCCGGASSPTTPEHHTTSSLGPTSSHCHTTRWRSPGHSTH
jgi:hypothetical protein